YRAKLLGNEEERAVSPVIGVILMVAITVILAAVIAAFVLDLGDSVGQEAQAGVTIEVDEENNEVQIEVMSLGNADHVDLKSSDFGSDTSEGDSDISGMTVGDTVTLSESSPDDLNSAGTISAVAVIDADGTETQVSSEDWDF
ncbi:type IV pilin, partial [Natrialba sp. SSL1]